MSKTTNLSASEAARLLAIELNYLYILCRTGRLEARKQEGEWVVSTKAVKERLDRLSQ